MIKAYWISIHFGSNIISWLNATDNVTVYIEFDELFPLKTGKWCEECDVRNKTDGKYTVVHFVHAIRQVNAIKDNWRTYRFSRATGVK